MTSQASLSLSLLLTKSLTHNIGSASALPIIRLGRVKKKKVVYHPRPPRFSCLAMIFFYFLLWEKLVYVKVGIRSSSIPSKCRRKSSRKKVNKFHWALFPVRSVAHCMHMGAKHAAVDLQYRTSFLLPLSPRNSGARSQKNTGKKFSNSPWALILAGSVACIHV